MIEQDTIRLLRECDAGVKMGLSSIEDVLGYARSGELREILNTSRREHEGLENELTGELTRFSDEGKSPNFVARGMAHLKTEAKLMMHPDDKTVATLICEGCDMGVRSLSKYLNQYAAADERSKDITKRIISIEENLSHSMRDYL